ncbi:hypothetical protein V5D56_13375 [Cellulosimicrobium sp. PMB13]|uniref:hypothetical protein n=1 Tax=Cellulosimicrobium sp. PMB13 TaxID=3120158 RepID=UPI003F4C55AC
MSGADGVWHDAFISYSTLGSAQLGAALELGLEEYGRRWDEPRARDVFRDVADQPATSDLAADLLTHLDRSRFLVFIASPRAVASMWVRQELEHWIARRGTDQLLLVLGEGTLGWDQSQGRFGELSTLPESLRRAFRAQPKWVSLTWTADGFDPADVRFAAAVADLAATIDGVPRAVLESRHRGEHRRGLAHRLAASAGGGVDTPADLNLLLATTASELDDSPHTRRVLSSALEATSSLTLLLGADVAVSAVSHAAESGSFLVGRTDGTVERWCGPERRDVWVSGRALSVTAIADDATGDRFAVGFADGRVELRGRLGLAHQWTWGPQAIDEIALHPLADVVAAASSGMVKVFAPTGIHEYDGFVSVHLLRFSGDLLDIFAWAALYQLDLTSWELTRVRSFMPLARPGPVAFATDSERWVQCQLDGGGIQVHSFGSDDESFVQSRRGFIDAAALSPEGRWLAIAASGSLVVFDLETGGPPDRTHPLVGRSVTRLLVGPDGHWVAALSGSRCELHQSRPSTLCRVLQPHAVDVPSVVQAALDVSFSPDGSLLACISFPTGPAKVSVWDVASWIEVAVIAPPDAMALRFLDAQHLEIRALDGTATVHDVPTDEVLHEAVTALAGPRLRVEQLTGRWGLAVTADGIVVAEVEQEGPASFTAAVTTDGTRLAVSSSHGVLTLRDIEAQVDVWSAVLPQMAELVFTAAGDMLAGVTGGGLLVLVDALNGNVTARLQVADAPVHRMAFDPWGRHLAVAAPGGPLTLIDADVSSWRRLAALRAGRTLTPNERRLLGLDSRWV